MEFSSKSLAGSREQRVESPAADLKQAKPRGTISVSVKQGHNSMLTARHQIASMNIDWLFGSDSILLQRHEGVAKIVVYSFLSTKIKRNLVGQLYKPSP